MDKPLDEAVSMSGRKPALDVTPKRHQVYHHGNSGNGKTWVAWSGDWATPSDRAHMSSQFRNSRSYYDIRATCTILARGSLDVGIMPAVSLVKRCGACPGSGGAGVAGSQYLAVVQTAAKLAAGIAAVGS